MPDNPLAAGLLAKIKSHDALAGIIGMGYVGLPLALAFVEKGFPVLGFDVDPEKVAKLNRGESYIKHLDEGRVVAMAASGRFQATADFARLAEPDAILICVPTPLTPQREPDMSYVVNSANQVAATLRPGQLIILESTTYPGTTDELLRSILEGDPDRLCGARAPRVLQASPVGPDVADTSLRGREAAAAISPANPSLRATPSEARGSDAIPQANPSLRASGASEAIPSLSQGLHCGTDFFLAFSPEREDPGNKNYGTTNTPKVVGGVDKSSGDLAQALYDQIISCTVRVSSARAAEATKLMENIFRAVNIALVNELKVVYDRMGIDIWEVLDAAETKPFGFMRFNPGPGWGGHCVAAGEWVRVRGCGLDGPQRVEELFDRLKDSCPAAMTRQGVYLRPQGMEALALDTASGDVAWFPVESVYRGRYRGEGRRVMTQDHRTLVVTDAHPMLVHNAAGFAVRPARDLAAGDELPVCSDPGEERTSGSTAARDREQIAPGLSLTCVATTERVALDGHVFSLEVPGVSTFTTTRGIAVHNCIPLDPFYLSWKAREVGVSTKFIELAGEVNINMPRYVVEKLQRALNERGKPVNGSKILILGIAYKRDIDDDRESPAYEVMDLLEGLGAEVSYHDPHIPHIPPTRRHRSKAGLASVRLTEVVLQDSDAVVIVTDHAVTDFDLVAKHAQLVVDTRGVLPSRPGRVERA